MTSKHDRNYVARHKQIVNKLMEMVEESGSGCVLVTKVADELGMDRRTVRAHLKIIEANHAGVFADTGEREFCTKEGVALLAKRLGLIEIADE